MTDEKSLKERITGYFTTRDWVIISCLAIVAFITNGYGLRYILPGGAAPSFVHGFLKLPGPGAGIFIGSAFICVWLVLGILLTQKPGTVLAIVILIMVISPVITFAIGGHSGGSAHIRESPASNGSSLSGSPGAGDSAPASSAVSAPSASRTNRTSSDATGSPVRSSGQNLSGGNTDSAAPPSGSPAGRLPAFRFDLVGFLVAIIIEGAGFLPFEKKPYRFIFPAFLAVMGIITLALMLTGNAKMGESGAAATVFPLGYAVSGILAIALGIIIIACPAAKYIVGAGFAEMFNIAFRWSTNGKGGFFSWVPVPLAIPPLLTFAFVCGATMAAVAYGIYLVWNTYALHRAKPS